MKPIDANGDDITGTDASTDPLVWLVFWFDVADTDNALYARTGRGMTSELLRLYCERSEWKEGFLPCNN